jgi:hypothetical protein
LLVTDTVDARVTARQGPEMLDAPHDHRVRRVD